MSPQTYLQILSWEIQLLIYRGEGRRDNREREGEGRETTEGGEGEGGSQEDGTSIVTHRGGSG